MKLKILVLSFLFMPCILLAQDNEFSQFFANPLHLNPALTGTSELPRTVISYRNQWPQKGNSFTTYSVSFDYLLKKRNAGAGIKIFHDQEPNNIINKSSATLSYAYHLTLGLETFMTLGLDAGIVLKQYNMNGLIFPSEIDQLSGTITPGNPIIISDEKKSYPDFAVGMAGQHKEVFWGASFHHITRPDESITAGDEVNRIPMKITLHAGARTHKLHHGLLSRPFTLSPNILYQQQGSFKQLNLGLYMIEKSFLFGGWFRNNIDTRPDAFIFLIGFARENFQFGYSFDSTLSKLSNYSHGSHEFSLTLFLGKKSQTPIRNKLLIPMI